MKLTVIGRSFAALRMTIQASARIENPKLLRVMKLTATILLAACLQVSARGLGQTVTLSVKDAPLEKVFSAIEKQTGFFFTYTKEQLQNSKLVSVEVRNASLTEVLDICFKNQPVTYEIMQKAIIVKEKKSFVRPIIAELLPIDIHGRVVNEKGEPMEGVTVIVKGTKNGTSTNKNGEFELKGVDEDAVIVISGVTIETFEVKVAGKSELALTAKIKVAEMSTVQVISTGYQTLSPNQTTGSYTIVEKELLNRSVNSNIISRIENLTTSVLFDKTPGLPGNSLLLIRGRSSIFSNVAPLIVLDNFPYNGDINNINPNDIESVTILKDAAAASIWGASSGNGVIVLTSKRGRTAKPQVEFNSNISIQGRPDLSKMRTISSSDEIEVEKWLFDKGFYNANITNTTTRPPLSPVQEILLKKRNGLISAAEAEAQIGNLKQISVVDDLEKYFYRPAVSQRNALNVSGSATLMNYYLGIGWDRSLSNLVGQKNDRISLNSRNSFKVSNRFQIDVAINYTQQNSKSGNNPGTGVNSGAGKGLYPYADLVDNNGNALVLVRNYRSGYTDTAGIGKLLDWKYRPLDEIHASENINKTRDFLINSGISYKFNRVLQAELKYSFQNSVLIGSNLNRVEAFSTRDLVNNFYQPNATLDKQFPVPVGGILTASNSESVSHAGRFQINYNQSWNQILEVSAIGGWEIRDVKTKASSSTLYGYNENGNIVNPNMDYVTLFPQYINRNNVQSIPNAQGINGNLDRFLSYFANASFSFKNRYTISASGRQDAANLFGVSANQRGVPLWSAGISWQINKENFYKLDLVPNLRLRATYGYNGNYSRQTSAFPTATFQVNTLGVTWASIRNPPNENLRWEQVRILNLALDFRLKNNRVSGSIEYWKKNCKDLMAQAPIDPTSGLNASGTGAYFFGNVASMKGHGFDVEIISNNLNKKFKWQTTFLFSYAMMVVSEYFLPASTRANDYTTPTTLTPIIGKPIYTLYSYPWGGLDPNNGDPIGYVNKQLSRNWTAIINNTPVSSMIYHGPVQPPYFGAFRNQFSWKNLSLSTNISFKAGYYFRRSSISYSGLYNSWTGHGDYALRWQKPGDENFTTVPSQVYTNYTQFSDRQSFYLRSEILAEKGDHVRWEDVDVSYSIRKEDWKRLPFREVRIYGFIGNMGIMIWTANKKGIDPAHPNGNTNRMSFSIGSNIIF